MKINKPLKAKGTIILNSVNFENVIKKKVISNNKTSSKITLPKELEGKEVYVVWEEK